MKYNLSEICSRAWSIAENSAVKFGGKASEYIDESLRISWNMAKLAILEDEKFLLDMKDISGGKTNVFAQQEIAEYNKELNRVARAIEELQAAIYPTITVTETFDNLRAEEKQAIEMRITNLEEKIASIKSGSNTERTLSKNEEILLKLGLLKTTPKAQNNTAELFHYEEMLRQAKNELKESVRIYTRTVLDFTAYDVVA